MAAIAPRAAIIILYYLNVSVVVAVGLATKVTGSYVEKGDDGKEKKVKERSHVVTSGKMGKRKFKKAVKSLGKKYGQDSVLTQTKKSGTLSATRKGGLGKDKRIGVGKFKPQGKNPEGQSQIKGKTFTYG